MCCEYLTRSSSALFRPFSISLRSQSLRTPRRQEGRVLPGWLLSIVLQFISRVFVCVSAMQAQLLLKAGNPPSSPSLSSPLWATHFAHLLCKLLGVRLSTVCGSMSINAVRLAVASLDSKVEREGGSTKIRTRSLMTKAVSDATGNKWRSYFRKLTPRRINALLQFNFEATPATCWLPCLIAGDRVFANPQAPLEISHPF